VQAETPVVTIFGKSWDFHVHTALRIPLNRNCELIRSSVAFLKSKGREVIYDAEHFFDGFAANPEYALQTLRAAEEGGADLIALCDTNGDLPHRYRWPFAGFSLDQDSLGNPLTTIRSSR
jgi:2-isopropylmalate synthase